MGSGARWDLGMEIATNPCLVMLATDARDRRLPEAVLVSCRAAIAPQLASSPAPQRAHHLPARPPNRGAGSMALQTATAPESQGRRDEALGRRSIEASGRTWARACYLLPCPVADGRGGPVVLHRDPSQQLRSSGSTGRGRQGARRTTASALACCDASGALSGRDGQGKSRQHTAAATVGTRAVFCSAAVRCCRALETVDPAAAKPTSRAALQSPVT
ncbi:hypothetical protein BS50DRAFT_584085 [Corynespora cassiicola Philippines]|uniref:Uncharacterized protein n=1 Tax=Corynespora cassiicola Philippines TaxID=1448308 RepID=A0A2T2P5G4_CORCC|nr:hypothetical protein BS50DRAFT_584085 [Corynespora cassiicola Philippines]